MPRFEILKLPLVPLLLMRSQLVRQLAGILFLAVLAVQLLLLWPAYVKEYNRLLENVAGQAQAAVRTAVHAYAIDANTVDVEAMAEAVTHRAHSNNVLGGAVFDAEGSLLSRFGEPLYFEPAELSEPRTDIPGDRMEFLIEPELLDVPLIIAVRADTSWIPSETSAHMWQALGAFLLISVLASLAATLVVTRMIIEPLLALRASLVAAGRDPTNAAEFAPPRRDQGVLGDISHIIKQLLQRVSQTFREELTSFAAMVEHTGEAVFAYDSDRILVYANKACLKYCSVSSVRELKGLGGPQFRVAPEGEPQDLNLILLDDQFAGEVDLILPDGEAKRCLMSAARVRTEDGRVLRTFASLSDITVIRESQWAVEQKNSELEEANRIKAEFLAKMSHELRTPLNAIIGFSEILSARPQTDEDSDVHTFAADINNSGHHLLGLINDILDLSKLEAGKQELTESNADLVDLAKSAVAMLRETARQHGVELERELPEEPLEIKCDAIRIKQVLLNLISNAIKFTTQGGSVLIGIRQGRDQIEVYVKDTGIGMRPEDIPKALQPFAQIDTGLSRRFDGTGLGLPICSGIVELHGGKMDIQSVHGEGTIVSFTLPASRVVSAAA